MSDEPRTKEEIKLEIEKLLSEYLGIERLKYTWSDYYFRGKDGHKSIEQVEIKVRWE